MRHARRLWLCLVVGIALAATTVAPAGVSVAVKKPTRLQQLARGLVGAGSPGAIVFVRTPKGTRSGVAGYASLTPPAPMHAADRYRIASVTKTFVAAVILELAAEGRLRLDDTIESWLPGKVPNGAAITLRELLNHTSGLFNYTGDQRLIDSLVADPMHAWTPQQMLDVAFSHPPNFAPGTNWSYSNTGYILLGLVIEAVTHEPVGEVLQELIFDPLSLRSTSFATSITEPEPFVHGYVDLGGGDVDITSLLSPTWAYTAGAIVSNAADVTKFYGALLAGRLLPPFFLTQMKTTTTVSGTYGLGIAQTSTKCGRAYGHDGDFYGWRNTTLSTANGKRQAVVVLNTGSRVSQARMEAAAMTALCSS